MVVPILGETKRRILKELGRNNLHGYELASRLNIPLTGIYQHLKELTEDGLISANTQNGRKKIYSLTKKGENLLSILDDKHSS